MSQIGWIPGSRLKRMGQRIKRRVEVSQRTPRPKTPMRIPMKVPAWRRMPPAKRWEIVQRVLQRVPPEARERARKELLRKIAMPPTVPIPAILRPKIPRMKIIPFVIPTIKRPPIPAVKKVIPVKKPPVWIPEKIVPAIAPPKVRVPALAPPFEPSFMPELPPEDVRPSEPTEEPPLPFEYEAMDKEKPSEVEPEEIVEIPPEEAMKEAEEETPDFMKEFYGQGGEDFMGMLQQEMYGYKDYNKFGKLRLL